MLISTMMKHLDIVRDYLVEEYENVVLIHIADSKDVFTFSAELNEDKQTIVTTKIVTDDKRILYMVNAFNQRTGHYVYVGDVEI